MVVRFFALEPEWINKNKAEIYPDNNDLSPISNLKVIANKYSTNDGKMVVKVDITDYLIKDMSKSLEAEEVLSLEGVSELGILSRYIGETKEDVLLKYPELNEDIQIDIDSETNEPIYENKYTIGLWNGEK